jgi:hypothetical protein
VSKDLTSFGNPSGLDSAEAHELAEQITENLTTLLGETA